MPNCRTCSAYYPYRVVIEGKIHNLQNRKSCLACWPFKKTRKKESGPPVTCKLCNREYVFTRGKGHRVSICNSCNANRLRNSRKIKAVAYKGGSCIECGYNKSVKALHFHHRERSDKKFNLCGMWSASWERLKLELDKCDLMCANCHMELEHGF